MEKDPENNGREDRRKGKPARAKPGAIKALEESAVGDSEIVAIEPASGEPLTQEESSAGLTLLAGATVLILGATAGVIAWRRRV